MRACDSTWQERYETNSIRKRRYVIERGWGQSACLHVGLILLIRIFLHAMEVDAWASKGHEKLDKSIGIKIFHPLSYALTSGFFVSPL